LLVENSAVPEDRRVWQEAVSLLSAGWDVTVLAPNEVRARQPVSEVLDGIAVHRFELRPSSGGAVGWAREYACAMWELWRSVRRLDRAAPFTVVHAANPPDFLLAVALRQRSRGAALIFDQHDLVPEMASERFGRRGAPLRLLLLAAERFAYRVADVTLSANESFRRVALERGGRAAEDVVVVRNGPRLEQFVPLPADRSLARGRKHLLVYEGLMGPLDGVDQALHALAALRRRRSDWHALLLGDGETLADLRRLCAELDLHEHVELPGFVDDTVLRRAICSATLCLAPDPRSPLTERSTLMKVAEYMALGRPVVAYDLAETRVTAGDTAAYALGDEPEDFAQAIDELLDDPDRREALGREARARIERGFAWEHSERALLDAYERATAKAARRRGGERRA
jgi:glycosyltransferase involved in cell wall biosynthesis